MLPEAQKYFEEMSAQLMAIGPWNIAKKNNSIPRVDHVAEFRAKRPWLATCEECSELEDVRKLGGRCKVLFSMDKYKGCGCGGRVENIIGRLETKCPLGKFELEEMSSIS